MELIDIDKGTDWMSFSARFLQLRKQNSLTQPQMADRVGIHLTQVRRYESGEAQPSLDILKRIAVTFNVSADWLIFEEEEREPQDELKLKFEAVKQMDEEEQRSVTAVLDALILKYQAKRLIG
ncbi:helix-turn-helix transcriptional regulator [Xenorhabdus griffiniae]|nr:helix-turn-helix transcriptional regulator [Xenorhabdus griffiniae]MBD1228110.1 helix-turn-helix transcriptional regulator [Xenorhabdus griffiniae]MBE8587574.1 helix-turn-helix transcriptional regulator [Xenorhabdus griffiniae]